VCLFDCKLQSKERIILRNTQFFYCFYFIKSK